MGIVLRARDTKLDRDVALKVLPEPFVRPRPAAGINFSSLVPGFRLKYTVSRSFGSVSRVQAPRCRTRLAHCDGGSALRLAKRLPAPAKGPRKKKFPFWALEALG